MHAGQGQGALTVDAADTGMGMRAAHEAGMQHAGQMQVIDEMPLPGEQRMVFQALYRRTDPGVAGLG